MKVLVKCFSIFIILSSCVLFSPSKKQLFADVNFDDYVMHVDTVNNYFTGYGKNDLISGRYFQLDDINDFETELRYVKFRYNFDSSIAGNNKLGFKLIGKLEEPVIITSYKKAGKSNQGEYLPDQLFNKKNDEVNCEILLLEEVNYFVRIFYWGYFPLIEAKHGLPKNINQLILENSEEIDFHRFNQLNNISDVFR